MEQATFPAFLPQLSAALAVLLDRMDATEARKRAGMAAAHITDLMRKTPAPEAHFTSFAGAFKALAGHLSREDAAALAGQVVEQMSRAPHAAALQSLRDALEALVERLDERELVELLKAPTAVGLTEDVLLRRLGRRAGRSFDRIWDAVRWLKEKREVDLRSPPHYPDVRVRSAHSWPRTRKQDPAQPLQSREVPPEKGTEGMSAGRIAPVWTPDLTQLCPYLDGQRAQLNRSIQHFSYDRLAYEPTKVWNISTLVTELAAVWDDFLSRLPPRRRQWFARPVPPAQQPSPSSNLCAKTQPTVTDVRTL
jgi:hypothetical protein